MTPKQAIKKRKGGGQKRRTGEKAGKHKNGVKVFKNGTGQVRLGKNAVDVITGNEDLSQWTNEELLQGYKSGVARHKKNDGKLPKLIPREIFEELASRLVYYARHTMTAELRYAVEKHIQIIKAIDETEPTGPQIKAIDMLYERVLGKPTEHVAIYNGGEMPAWQKAVAQGIVGTIEQAKELEDGTVVEGELVEDEEPVEDE